LLHFAACPRCRACPGGENVEKKLKLPQFEPKNTGRTVCPARQGKRTEPEQFEQVICEPGTCAESVQLDICQPQPWPVNAEPKQLEQIVCQKGANPEPIQHDYLEAVGSQPE